MIFVTGGAGFVGQKVCLMMSNNSQLIYADNNKTISQLEKNIQVQGDITDEVLIQNVCSEYSPNIIIHCAGIAHQKIGSIDRNEYFRVNSLATENLAKAAISSNSDVHFIFLSSISVYGEDHRTGSVSEDALCNPSSDYAESKLDAEKRLQRLYDSGQLKRLDILRLAPVYDSEWSLNLNRRVFAPKKSAYIRFGKGDQKMSAVSRQNLVDFIEYLTNQSERFGERYSNIYNVCDEQPYTFNQIIETFKRSPYHPDHFVVTVPLSVVWLLTRMTGLVFKNKRQWLHSCYDKLAKDLVFDNRRMLSTGFRPKQTLESVFLNPQRILTNPRS